VYYIFSYNNIIAFDDNEKFSNQSGHSNEKNLLFRCMNVRVNHYYFIFWVSVNLSDTSRPSNIYSQSWQRFSNKHRVRMHEREWERERKRERALDELLRHSSLLWSCVKILKVYFYMHNIILNRYYKLICCSVFFFYSDVQSGISISGYDHCKKKK